MVRGGSESIGGFLYLELLEVAIYKLRLGWNEKDFVASRLCLQDSCVCGQTQHGMNIITVSSIKRQVPNKCRVLKVELKRGPSGIYLRCNTL